MALSGASDWTPLACAVTDTRERAGRYAPSDRREEAEAARREAGYVEAWEARRNGRFVRLWVLRVRVEVAALDWTDARWRLCGYLRRPYHRVGDAPVLYALGRPTLREGSVAGVDVDYPLEALDHRQDRAPFGAFERAHVDQYVRALRAARARALIPAERPDWPECAAPGEGHWLARSGVPDHVRLGLWRCCHQVLFLAGPGEAESRAQELASTIVSHTGCPLGVVAALEPDDGHAAADGRWVHPACTLGPARVAALWDDYDLAQHDVGETAALADVYAYAAERVRMSFERDARRHSVNWNAVECKPMQRQ